MRPSACRNVMYWVPAINGKIVGLPAIITFAEFNEEKLSKLQADKDDPFVHHPSYLQTSDERCYMVHLFVIADPVVVYSREEWQEPFRHDIEFSQEPKAFHWTWPERV